MVSGVCGVFAKPLTGVSTQVTGALRDLGLVGEVLHVHCQFHALELER